MTLHNKLPEKSVFGFKILGSWQSVFTAYLFLISEFLATPYFGFERIQYIAGLTFILLINISIVILIFNSCIRRKKLGLFFLLGAVPLIIYIPFSLQKIFLIVSRLWTVIL